MAGTCTEDAAISSAWTRYIADREKATFTTTLLLICVLVPAWSAVDFVLEPSMAAEFALLRLLDVALTAVFWIFVVRSNATPRARRVAMLAAATAVGIMIATMLPQVHHYLVYVLGFSLVFWGCGLLLLWPVSYLIAMYAIVLGYDVALQLVVHRGVPGTDFVGALFYLASVAVISCAQVVVRRRLEHRAYRSAFSLERRNEELRQTVDTLRAARTHLAASSALLADSLDAGATGRHVMATLVPAIGEWAALDGPGPFESRTISVAHADPLQRDVLLQRLQHRHTHEWTPARASEHVVAPTRDALGRVLGIDTSGLAETRWLVAAPLVVRGQVAGCIVLGRDERDFTAAEIEFAEEIARRAALALENARLYRESEEAVRLREELISIAGHELRTPLGVQVLTVSNLLESTAPQDAKRPLLTKLERQVSRLTEQVDQLLDISRIAAGKLVLQGEDVDFVAVVQSVAEKLEDTAAQAGSPIVLDVPASLHGHWDRTRLEQVVSNLVVNGIKYGSGHPVQVSLRDGGGRALLAVTDHGVGIAEQDRARIFLRFERAASARYGGVGIGLWLVRAIIDAMGGTIRVESELGKGSTFRVEVPLVS